MSSYRQLQSAGDVRASLPSNVPAENGQADAYVFNSIGFYGDLLARLDGQIRTTEEIYKQSFYKVTAHQRTESPNHFMRSAQKENYL
jgi:hypothetical protein